MLVTCYICVFWYLTVQEAFMVNTRCKFQIVNLGLGKVTCFFSMVTVSLHGNFTFSEKVAWIDGTCAISQKTGDHLANRGWLLPLREENQMKRLQLVAAGRRRLVEHHLVRLRQPLVAHNPCALLPQVLVLQNEAPARYWKVTSKSVFRDLILLTVKCPQLENELQAVGSAALVLLQAG